MPTREAACSCGQLRLTAEGDPVRISMCHCLACQRRTGSAFGLQARFPEDRVSVVGRHTEYVRMSDEGEPRTFRFCPDCGATVFWTTEHAPELIAVAIGAFADPTFPQPTVSVYDVRRHPWLGLPDAIDHEND
ncbi:MAG TPA: GFA family protein [Gaiellaceae bacterium]